MVVHYNDVIGDGLSFPGVVRKVTGLYLCAKCAEKARKIDPNGRWLKDKIMREETDKKLAQQAREIANLTRLVGELAAERDKKELETMEFCRVDGL